MIIDTRYICEYCGRDYESKDNCKECEESHGKPVEIIKYSYSRSRESSRYYPSIIYIKMDDGQIVTYKH